MKLKDLINTRVNSVNKQSIWNPKKRKLKEIGLNEEDILNIKIDSKFKRFLK